MTKKQKGKIMQMPSPENYIRQKARSLPVFECWVNTGWEEGGLANLIIARNHTNGNITLGMYLVDLKCLGIKDSTYKFNIPEFEYREMLSNFEESMDIETISYPLAHNIVYAGLEFAEEYSFKPHKDFAIAQYILDEDTDDIELMEIECGGDDGKPFYVQGPLDNDARANQVIAHLEKYAGAGNYDFILAGDEDFDDDDWDEDEYDQWHEKYGNLPLGEKISLFEKKLTVLDKLSEEEQNEFAFLFNSILDNYIDYDVAGSLTGNLLDAIEDFEITENPLPGFLGVETGSEDELGTLQQQAIKIYSTAGSNIKEAKNQLNRLKKIYPEAPVLYFLEIIVRQSEKSKSTRQKTEEYYQRFPNYALIKIERAIDHRIAGKRVNIEELFAKGPREFFAERTKLHPLELHHYLMLLAFSAMMEMNITCLEALDNLIEELTIEGTDYMAIGELIATARINFVLSLKGQSYKKSSPHNDSQYSLPS